MSTNIKKNLSLWPKIYPALGFIGGLAFAFCQWLIYIYAPTEATLGLSQKLFYYHLPLAWWGLFSFFLNFIASIAYLKSKKQKWDSLAEACAGLGLLMAVLALVVGMFWARSAWGIWWTWDPRLTTTLIMCFIYAAYIILRQVDIAPSRKASISAVVGIIAFLDVPLVFISARLWSYIHPPKIEMDPDMRITLVACIIAFGFIWISLVSLRYYLSRSANCLESIVTEEILKNN